MSSKGAAGRLDRCAVLLGVSTYRDARQRPVPAAANSLRRMRQLLTDSSLCGWPPEQVTVIENADRVPEIAVQLRELAARTDGMFLFYFVGHGTLSERGELFFSLSDTNTDHVDLTGMPYAHVRDALLDSPARVKISILDCCYSGRAVQTLSAQADSLALAADVRGAYVWTAADGPAHVVPLDQQADACTSFTGELISLVREGVPNGPTALTLEDLYEPLRQRMRALGLPLPNRRVDDTASSALFTWNAWETDRPAASVRDKASSQAGRNGLVQPPSRAAAQPVIGRRDLAALKATVPLKDVVTEYVPLRKSGHELRGSCPFCEGSSGQFSVNSDKGVYHCFECHAGGDALDFIMKMEHLSFGEAVDRLASHGGITLRADAGHHDRQHVERIRLVEAHSAAAQFYFTQLNTTKEAAIGRAFLAERGIDQAAAEHFSVGYSPQGWDHLTRFLRGKGFTDKELLLSGLSQEGRRGPIDRFRGRLMWPIRNIGGEIVGFGARKLYEADNGPKYINTPDTSIYKKAQALFGIDLAKKGIAKTNQAVVVEGYIDVMACHLAGIHTAVATCGTPFSTDHITILRRLLKGDGSARITFVSSHDGHAHQSALRTLKDDQQFAAHSYVTVAPDGMSASELRIAKGDAAVAELAEPRTPLSQFILRQIISQHDLETTVGQNAALAEAAPTVARITDGMTQRQLAIELASMLGYPDENVVVRHIRHLTGAARNAGQTHAAERPPSHTNTETPLKPVISLRGAVHATERELLKIALQRPDLVSPAFDAYGIEEFTAPPYAAVRRAIMEAGGAEYGVQHPQEYLSLVREAASDDAVRSMITELTAEPIMRRKVDDAYAGDQLVAVRRRSVDRRMQDLLGVLARESDQKDPSRSAAVQNEVWKLQQYWQALREQGAKAL